jgi:hypothetical protein
MVENPTWKDIIAILDFLSKAAILIVAIRWVTIDLPGQQKVSKQFKKN